MNSKKAKISKNLKEDGAAFSIFEIDSKLFEQTFFYLIIYIN